MNQFSELIDALCAAIDARHTGCEIEVSNDGIRVISTFSYPSARDLLITDVLRAVASRDWRRSLAEAQAAQTIRVDAYEANRKREMEETRKALRLRGAMMQRPRPDGVDSRIGADFASPAPSTLTPR